MRWRSLAWALCRFLLMSLPTLDDDPPIELSHQQPVLLLDIDGVINVFQCPATRAVQLAPYLPDLHLRPAINEWLAQLSGAFYLIWCSSWGPLVNRDAARTWGLAPRPSIKPLPAQAAGREWKLLAAQQIFATWQGALAWVEDGFRPAAHAWAAQRLRSGAPTWLVDVSEEGLTAEVTAALLAWVRGAPL